MENKHKKKIIVLLTFFGIFVSSYLTYYKLSTNPLVCNFGGCDIVQASKYAEFLGIPVAIWGVIYYGTLLILVLKDINLLTRLWIFWGIIFSIYLTYIELFVLKAICGWCVVSFAIILLIAMFYFVKGKPAHDLSSV